MSKNIHTHLSYTTDNIKHKSKYCNNKIDKIKFKNLKFIIKMFFCLFLN